jgi:hypothetical protein
MRVSAAAFAERSGRDVLNSLILCLNSPKFLGRHQGIWWQEILPYGKAARS